MDNISQSLAELQTTLFDQPEVKQFFALRKAIEEDAGLMESNALMRKHQKAMAVSLGDDKAYHREKALFEKYANEYNNHPLVVNYETVKAIVNDLLIQLKTIIE